jgi:hypothetical protein
VRVEEEGGMYFVFLADYSAERCAPDGTADAGQGDGVGLARIYDVKTVCISKYEGGLLVAVGK